MWMVCSPLKSQELSASESRQVGFVNRFSESRPAADRISIVENRLRSLRVADELSSGRTYRSRGSQMPVYQAYPASHAADPQPLPIPFMLSVTVRRVMNFRFL